MATDKEKQSVSAWKSLGSTRFRRRDILKMAGFSFAGALYAGCQRAPVIEAIPYLVQPEGIVPGEAYHYASTCGACEAACGLMVKNRDGRPIKLEGNPAHPLSKGGVCAIGQASLLGLYDTRRLKNPMAGGAETSWKEADNSILAKLNEIKRKKGSVRFLTGSMTSRATLSLLDEFLGGFSDSRHIIYDPISSSAILDAHEKTHGARVLPRYRFDKSEVIVSFDADFLGTWVSPVEFTKAYSAGRDLRNDPPKMSYHAHFEPIMSVTGAKADERHLIRQDQIGPVVSLLAAKVAQKVGAPFDARGITHPPVSASVIEKIAEKLLRAKGKSIVVSASQDIQVQILCNFINHHLNNYGSTIDIEQPSYQKQGDDGALETLLEELKGGKVDALFISGVNPVYDLPGGDEIAGAIKKVGLAVDLSSTMDETAEAAHYVCPDHHYLESWRDMEPVSGVLSITQPAMRPMGNARSIMESLCAWMEKPRKDYDIVKNFIEENYFQRQSSVGSFQVFWDMAVHDGSALLDAPPPAPAVRPFDASAVKPVLNKKGGAGPFALILYPKVGIGDGRNAVNPWLQELPDPITKVTWDNCARLSPAAAEKLGIEDGDIVGIEAGGKILELPAVVQPGQRDDVVAAAIGYGRKGTERFADIGPDWIHSHPSVGPNGLAGVNAAPMLSLANGAIRYHRAGVTVKKSGGNVRLAFSQTQHFLDVPSRLHPPDAETRPIFQQTTLKEYIKDRSSGKPEHHHPYNPDESLWPVERPYKKHHWGMVIDLTACTGCSACVISCQAENNIPAVGKDEVRRRREMHWMRIDRYYVANGDGFDAVYQPMLCHQCDNAPCETVCPVLATVHSDEGLNEQVYNRCVGTRYCANNCPYKVRRFNWFNYKADETRKMALNPDVTIRSRGVMEKCSFCVQRIQEAKIQAKVKGEKLREEDLKTACQQSCPANAISFGDDNDETEVARLTHDPRSFRALEELNVKPSVSYLRLVRNREKGDSRGKKVKHG